MINEERLKRKEVGKRKAIDQGSCKLAMQAVIII